MKASKYSYIRSVGNKYTRYYSINTAVNKVLVSFFDPTFYETKYVEEMKQRILNLNPELELMIVNCNPEEFYKEINEIKLDDNYHLFIENLGDGEFLIELHSKEYPGDILDSTTLSGVKDDKKEEGEEEL